MRMAVTLLILMNLGYFAWEGYQGFGRDFPKVAQLEQDTFVAASQRLVLLSEFQENEFASHPLIESRQPLESQRVSDVKNGVGECLFLGPFMASGSAEQVRQQLFSYDIDSEKHKSSRQAAVDYWVHIPPQVNREMTQLLHEELQSQGFDSFIISQGVLKSGISLGLYSDYETSQKVMRRMIEAGYSVETKVLPRRAELWWLQLSLDSEALLDDGFWGSLSQQLPEIKKEKKLCLGIATRD